jgi:hypothetical protein
MKATIPITAKISASFCSVIDSCHCIGLYSSTYAFQALIKYYIFKLLCNKYWYEINAQFFSNKGHLGNLETSLQRCADDRELRLCLASLDKILSRMTFPYWLDRPLLTVTQI